MGSVLAASSSPPAPREPGQISVPPGFTMPPVSSLLTPPNVGDQVAEVESPLPNPGTFEECHRKCKEIFPMETEGVRLVVNKGLSNHFQVNHTLSLSTLGDSSYRFGATYVGCKQSGPAESFPVMVGDMDNSGSLNAQVIHQLTERVRSKMAFQTQQQKFVNWQCDAEYRGADFTTAVTLGNPDLLLGSGIVVAHYLQSVTASLALGGELVYHCRPGEQGAVLSLAGRYTGTNYIATVTVGGAGAHASYYHRANEQLQVGVELEASTRMQDTSVSFGYQLDVPKTNLLFKGSIDSNWVVGATLEKKLLPLPLSLALGAFLNHRKNKFQCGFGITIG
ncbi:mitochondrial import receptor subunit TOM40 homolog isoform X1 [Brienomyrus brachyistius]|uniref:mitochondrial import receptor subunit TOM40 homolog isoform X1 n=1 Tax=Brienomyrus brachyistius TaxID=42636 RepID=UPI0020B1F3AA|nr:mitochondrial import receptor subunit TOM40 homolog isoform X1 [Brienomyrus brachyistius]